jgi:preprotein translocase subunit SecE
MSVVDRFVSFTQSAWVESKKVTWPSRNELKDSTFVVIVATFIIMLYLFLVDRILSFALNIFVG